MEINKQLFEDVLSGKLTGKFVLRNGDTYFSAYLYRNYNKFRFTYPYMIGFRSYTSKGLFPIYGESKLDIVNFIPDINMEAKLIEQKIKVSGWNEMFETTIKYPEDLEFYYTADEIGKCKHIKCEHYYAIFEKSRYSEEIINEIVSSMWRISKREFGDYIILIVTEVHNDTPLPNISRDEYFKKYNIDFSKYTAVLYTEDMYVANLARIINFENPYRIETLSITTKNIYDSSRKILQMGKDTVDLSAMMFDTSSQAFSKYKVEILNNDENGDIVWNIALRDTMKEFGYNPDILNCIEDESKYDLDLKHEKWREAIKSWKLKIEQLKQIDN